jgi:xanthine dehydrogenase accessory factor
MCIDGDRNFIGSVSGGCVEGAVIQEAEELLRSGGVKLLEYGVTEDQAWEVGLACGGSIEVFVEALDAPPWLDQVLRLRSAGEAVVIATQLSSGRRTVVRPEAEVPIGEPAETIPGLDEAARAAALADASIRWEAPDGSSLFLHVLNPAVRILVVGAVHIAQALSAMAREAGFHVSIVDPRAAFAKESRFPGVAVHQQWPAEALAAIGIHRRTAVVTVSHDPKLDDPALHAALASPAFYVGALGSRKTHKKRVARLSDAGFSESDIARVRAPVGLDIGARTPGEIAASVLAEIVQELRRPPA